MSKFRNTWEWVAHFPTVSGNEVLWCLERDGIRYASIHKRRGKYLAFLKNNMYHTFSAHSLPECASKIEAKFNVRRTERRATSSS
jgi:hypothetical protein